ncbi:MAG TPA: putative toxin-antitoxin system toxin component, PIN family [Thermomicrobiales bacterium]|nr:putative toxin-antitoxin system toxin component, PIN family [Thermomicrobiales bacterium]
MISALLDANVLASGIAGWRRQETAPLACLRRALNGDITLVISDELLNELYRTLQKPYFIQHTAPEDLNSVFQLILDVGDMAERTVIIHGVATHPEDDLILAAAVSADVDYLVTGDRQLLALGDHGGVRIVSPAAFLALLDADEPPR